MFNKIRKEFVQEGLNYNRKIRYEENFGFPVTFNAKVYSKKFYEKHKNNVPGFLNYRPLWQGDLNFSLDLNKLERLASKVGAFVIVSKEGEKKFELRNLKNDYKKIK
jgi:hypothetical protein